MDHSSGAAHQFAEFGFGAIVGIVNLVALLLISVFEMPVGVVFLASVLCGAVLGGFNGFLIGYLKARPFLTTMVTLIIYRAIVEIINKAYAVEIATAWVDNAA